MSGFSTVCRSAFIIKFYVTPWPAHAENQLFKYFLSTNSCSAIKVDRVTHLKSRLGLTGADRSSLFGTKGDRCQMASPSYLSPVGGGGRSSKRDRSK